MHDKIEHAIRELTDELRAGRQQRLSESEAFRSRSGLATKRDLLEMEQRIMINQKELAAGLLAVQTQVGKVAKEQSDRFDAVTAKVAELQAALDAAGDAVSTATEEAFTALKSAVQSLDDVIPDAPGTTTGPTVGNPAPV